MEDASASYCDHNENSLTIDISHFVCVRVFSFQHSSVFYKYLILSYWPCGVINDFDGMLENTVKTCLHFLGAHHTLYGVHMDACLS